MAELPIFDGHTRLILLHYKTHQPINVHANRDAINFDVLLAGQHYVITHKSPFSGRLVMVVLFFSLAVQCLPPQTFPSNIYLVDVRI